MKTLIITIIMMLSLASGSFGYTIYLTEPGDINYARVDITLNGAGTEASFVVTPLDVYYLVGNGTFDFNVSNTAAGPVHNIHTTLVSGSATPTVSYYNGVNQHNVAGFGVFNTVIDIGSGASDRATSLTFDLTGSWGDAADVLAIESAYKNDKGGYLAAAHIIGQGATFFVGNGEPGTPVPEPGTIVLLGAGLLGLGMYGRRRLR